MFGRFSTIVNVDGLTGYIDVEESEVDAERTRLSAVKTWMLFLPDGAPEISTKVHTTLTSYGLDVKREFNDKGYRLYLVNKSDLYVGPGLRTKYRIGFKL